MSSSARAEAVKDVIRGLVDMRLGGNSSELPLSGSGDAVVMSSDQKQVAKIMWTPESATTEAGMCKSLTSERYGSVCEVSAHLFRRNVVCVSIGAKYQSTLADAWKREDFLSDDRESIIARVLELLYMLEQLRVDGVLHRDIKPENILVTEGDGELKLIDFGLSRLAGNVPSTTGVYTLWYRPPEVAMAATRSDIEKNDIQDDTCAKVTHASDTFAMGLLIIEMLMRGVRIGAMAGTVPRYFWKENRNHLNLLSYVSRAPTADKSYWREHAHHLTPGEINMLAMHKRSFYDIPGLKPPGDRLKALLIELVRQHMLAWRPEDRKTGAEMEAIVLCATGYGRVPPLEIHPSLSHSDEIMPEFVEWVYDRPRYEDAVRTLCESVHANCTNQAGILSGIYGRTTHAFKIPSPETQVRVTVYAVVLYLKYVHKLLSSGRRVSRDTSWQLVAAVCISSRIMLDHHWDDIAIGGGRRIVGASPGVCKHQRHTLNDVVCDMFNELEGVIVYPYVSEFTMTETPGALAAGRGAHHVLCRMFSEAKHRV